MQPNCNRLLSPVDAVGRIAAAVEPAPNVAGTLGYEVAVGALLLIVALGAWARRTRFRGVIHLARRPRQQLPAFTVSRVDPPSRGCPHVLDGRTFRLTVDSSAPGALIDVLVELSKPVGVR